MVTRRSLAYGLRMAPEWYTDAGRASYKPPPCPACGSKRVIVSRWANASDAGSTVRKWIPALFSCLDCDGNGNRQ